MVKLWQEFVSLQSRKLEVYSYDWILSDFLSM